MPLPPPDPPDRKENNGPLTVMMAPSVYNITTTLSAYVDCPVFVEMSLTNMVSILLGVNGVGIIKTIKGTAVSYEKPLVMPIFLQECAHSLPFNAYNFEIFEKDLVDKRKFWFYEQLSYFVIHEHCLVSDVMNDLSVIPMAYILGACLAIFIVATSCEIWKYWKIPYNLEDKVVLMRNVVSWTASLLQWRNYYLRKHNGPNILTPKWYKEHRIESVLGIGDRFFKFTTKEGRIFEGIDNWPEKATPFIVETDVEHLLGLGDLGCQGMVSVIFISGLPWNYVARKNYAAELFKYVFLCIKSMMGYDATVIVATSPHGPIWNCGLNGDVNNVLLMHDITFHVFVQAVQNFPPLFLKTVNAEITVLVLDIPILCDNMVDEVHMFLHYKHNPEVLLHAFTLLVSHGNIDDVESIGGFSTIIFILPITIASLDGTCVAVEFIRNVQALVATPYACMAIATAVIMDPSVKPIISGALLLCSGLTPASFCCSNQPLSRGVVNRLFKPVSDGAMMAIRAISLREKSEFVPEFPIFYTYQFRQWHPDEHPNMSMAAMYSQFKPWDPGKFV